MSILGKMAVFIEKPPVTSSTEHYGTMKNALILMKINTSTDWKIASVLTFLLPWQRGNVSKLPKITILHCFFAHQNKLISKYCNFSMD
jgi:hypothetical protein